MTKKRTRKEQISDERKRNAILSKRLESLTKKANDLSILCGVDIGMVVHKPEENNAVLWPSPEVFRERMLRFLDYPDLDRRRKMVIHDKYLEEKYDDEKDDVVRTRKKMETMETQLIVNESVAEEKALDIADLSRLSELRSFAGEMLEKLRKREDALSNEQEQ